MARLIQFTILFIQFFYYYYNYIPTTAHGVSSNGTSVLLDSSRSAMILPLFLSPPSPCTKFSNTRRLLQRSNANALPNAHMRLNDDLLINGYYTTRLWIGTPPQRFALIVDTGSSVTYVPCSSCEQCGRHQIMKELHSLKPIHGPDPNYNDICFSGAGSDISQQSSTFPAVEMVFGNGQKLLLSPENYLFRGSCEALDRSCGCCGNFVEDDLQREQCESACDFATHVFCHPCALCLRRAKYILYIYSAIILRICLNIVQNVTPNSWIRPKINSSISS